MHSLRVMLHNELRYQLRSYRLLIVAAVFFLFGLGTPLLFNYLDVLIPAEDFVLPEFTATDVVEEYLSTVAQVGMLATILLAMGIVASERDRGTAAMTLSKPVGVGAFILAKFLALSATLAAGAIVGAAGAYLYTFVLFDDPGAGNFAAANMLAWVYLVFATSLTILFSSHFKNQLAAGGLALVILIVLALTSGLVVMREFSPGALMTEAQSLAAGAGIQNWGVVAATLTLIPLLLLAAWHVFRKKEL